MWPRIGPYHTARLEAAAVLFADRGVRIVCLESADRENACPWDVSEDDPAFEKRTVFPGADYETLGTRAIRHGVMSALRSIDPDTVVVCGWTIPESRAAIGWCRRRGRSVILMSESCRDDKPRSLPAEALKRRIVAQCDAALVGGKLQKEYVVLLGMHPDRVQLGYAAVDNDYFESAVSKVKQVGRALPDGTSPSPSPDPSTTGANWPCWLLLMCFPYRVSPRVSVSRFWKPWRPACPCSSRPAAVSMKWPQLVPASSQSPQLNRLLMAWRIFSASTQ